RGAGISGIHVAPGAHMAGSLEDDRWGGPPGGCPLGHGTPTSRLIPGRPTRGSAADLGVRPTWTAHAREAPGDVAPIPTRADSYIAPAASSAPSGSSFSYCFSPRLRVSAVK